METNHSDENLAPGAPSTPRGLSELDPDDARHSIATIKRSSSQSRKSLMELQPSSSSSGSPLAGKAKAYRQGKAKATIAVSSRDAQETPYQEYGQDSDDEFPNVKRVLFRAVDLIPASPSESSGSFSPTPSGSRAPAPQHQTFDNEPEIKARASRKHQTSNSEDQIDPSVPRKQQTHENSYGTESPTPREVAAAGNTEFEGVESGNLSTDTASQGTLSRSANFNTKRAASPSPLSPPNPEDNNPESTETNDDLQTSPDPALPATIQRHTALLAQQGTLFASTIESLNWGLSLVNSTDHDVNADSRIPRALRKRIDKAPFEFAATGMNPFAGARLSSAWRRRHPLVHLLRPPRGAMGELADGVDVPAVLPRTIAPDTGIGKVRSVAPAEEIDVEVPREGTMDVDMDLDSLTEEHATSTPTATNTKCPSENNKSSGDIGDQRGSADSVPSFPAAVDQTTKPQAQQARHSPEVQEQTFSIPIFYGSPSRSVAAGGSNEMRNGNGIKREGDSASHGTKDPTARDGQEDVCSGKVPLSLVRRFYQG
ncbi:hypothetical protein NEMBOFW57_009109 [Staphylotrichum longicolle]|uniref:Uncharacterized protein n=1 Tax=Staphylotrichum longicolle TaxID=669026 RepID=A0AAD4EWU8_9PEZI|nr:hypothetical protein NEMBOFW57_009109 [Staphylotrichum longicolle]